MKQIKKGWKKIIGWITVTSMLLSGLPMSDRISYADQGTEVSSLTLKTIHKNGKDWAGINIEGRGLKLENREILFNGTDITKMTGIEVIQGRDTSERYEVIYPIEGKNKFEIRAENSITVKGINAQKDEVYENQKFMGLTFYPTLDKKIDQKQFLNQEFVIFGKHLGNDSSAPISKEERALILGDVTNEIDSISENGTKLKVKSLSGPAGELRDVAFQIQIKGTQDKKDLIYQYVLDKVVIPVERLKFEDIDAVPNSGPISGGTTITIVAQNKDGVVIKDAFDDSPDFKAYLVNDKNTAKFELIRQNPENKDEFIAKTPKVSTKDLGKYRIMIKKGNAEVTSKNFLFTYITELGRLQLSAVKDDFAFDVEEKKIMVSGSNIFGLASLNLTNKGGMEIVGEAISSTDGSGNAVLKVTYKPKKGEVVTYGEGKIVEQIERWIYLEIGKPAIPVQGSIKTDGMSETSHYSFDVVDGVVFKTPDMTGADISGKKDIRMETTTKIKVQTNGVKRTLPNIYDEDVLKSKFLYKPTVVSPQVSSVEPLYGYYNFVDGKKPLMVRIKGSDFQVIKEKGNKILPTVTARKHNGGEEYQVKGRNAISVKVLKVLKGEVDVDGEVITAGDTIVAEISPSDSNQNSFAQLIKELGIQGNGYKWTPVKFLVEQPNKRGNNLATIQNEKALEVRYPTANEVQLQPSFDSPDSTVELGVFAGKEVKDGMSKVTMLNSDDENDIIVKFHATQITDFNKVLVSIDGMDMRGRISKRSYDPIDGYPYIVLKTPKGITGQTRLQVIVNEGLMDSYDLLFQPVTGPWLKELIPNNGQAGTWVTIKRDAAKNNVRFIVPSSTSSDEGSAVLLDGKKLTSDVFVKDMNTILFRIPENTPLGMRVIQVENPAGSGSSQGLNFLVRDVHGDKVEIESIDPNRGDIKGGLSALIKAKKGSNFSGGADVYFASQKAEVIGMNVDFTRIYVKVPQFVEKVLRSGDSYTVPVTVQKHESGATGTIRDGFTYFNPTDADKLKITEVYKKDVLPKTNRGNVGDEFWVEGTNFIIKQDEESKELIYPDIYFDYEKAEILEKYSLEGDEKEKRVPRLLVRVPKQTSGLKDQDSVDVKIINPNGATYIKSKGFIYDKNNPQILSKNLEASRFSGRIKVEAKDILKDPYVFFGEKVDMLDLGMKEDEMLTTHSEVEKIRIKYLGPKASPNFEIYYENPDGSLLLMSDATDGGKVSLTELGVKKLIRINWKNPEYHKNSTIAKNPDLLKKLNDEYMMMQIVRDGRVNKLQVRRGLGKVERYSLNQVSKVATMMISTPYNEKIEKTTITILNTDDSSASTPFSFNDALGILEITDIEASVERTVTIHGKAIKAKVKTQDITEDGVMTILGTGFKDILSVQLGGQEVPVESIGPKGDYIKVRVPKGKDEQALKPLAVDVYSKNGNDFSEDKTPPLYFMYVVTGSKPIIESMEPKEGPRTGGTLVRIKGKNFRDKDGLGVLGQVKVSVDGGSPIAVSDIQKNAQGEIVSFRITMPPHSTGKAELRVINADEGTSAPQEFHYISQPKIHKMGAPLFTNDTESVLKIQGEDFQEGAKVFIGAKMDKGKKKLEEVKFTGILGVTAGINQEVRIVGGSEGTQVKVEDPETLSFKLPAGSDELKDLSIIIANPDKGISEEGKGALKVPLPDVPVIRAIPGGERSIRLIWSVDKEKLNAAEKFEIYARESRDLDYVFVGDTKGTEFIVKGLEQDTVYDFKVRVLNKYGAVTDVGEVSARTLSRSEDYKEREKIEEAQKLISQIETQGKREVIGEKLVYLVGSEDEYIDLSGSKQIEKHIRIPIRELRRSEKNLRVSDKGMNLTLPYHALEHSLPDELSEEGYVDIKLSSAAKSLQESVQGVLPRNKEMNSRLYHIGAEWVDGRRKSVLRNFEHPLPLAIVPDRGKGRYAIGVYRYDEAAHRMNYVGGQQTAIQTGGYYVLLSEK